MLPQVNHKLFVPTPRHFPRVLPLLLYQQAQSLTCELPAAATLGTKVRYLLYHKGMLTLTTVSPLYAVYVAILMLLVLQPHLFLSRLYLSFLGCTVLLSHCPHPSYGLVLPMSVWHREVNHLHAGRGSWWFLRWVGLLAPPNLKTALPGRGRQVWYLLSEGLECMSYSSHGTVREDGWVGGQISCCLCR